MQVKNTRSTSPELVEELAEGRRSMHQMPERLSPEDAVEARRHALERLSGANLEHIAKYSFDAGQAGSANCENLIGVAQIPMGVIGPLVIRGQQVDPSESLYVPLATTEGALIASTNRGCSAIRKAGGAITRVEDVGMTRAPVFRTTGIEETQRFLAWIEDNHERMRKLTEGTSRYLRLKEIRTHTFGTSVYLRFRFTCGDAMGMNMVTIACDRVVRELIEPETGVPCIALSGNYCVDKKPSAINFFEGRGKRIYAEVNLDGSVLAGLKTNARNLVEVQYRKNLMGSIAAGAMGFNAHFANVLSALFVATGQDIAQVVEGSMGVTCVEPYGPEGVKFSVYMPDVPLGVIGGGTGLGTQSEALELLGVRIDPERPGAAVARLAEIVGAAVLAGEISLMAAFTSGDLAGAHERLGRSGEDG